MENIIEISNVRKFYRIGTDGFATLIGLISGFYPARRSMKLSALEAIKTE